APESIDYAIQRYTNEVRRIYGVMDRRLGEAEYLGGEYSIADIACWPWVKPYESQGQDLAELPNLKRWFDAVGAREAVQRGIEVLADQRDSGKSGQGFDDKAHEALFGAAQYERR